MIEGVDQPSLPAAVAERARGGGRWRAVEEAEDRGEGLEPRGVDAEGPGAPEGLLEDDLVCGFICTCIINRAYFISAAY